MFRGNSVWSFWNVVKPMLFTIVKFQIYYVWLLCLYDSHVLEEWYNAMLLIWYWPCNHFVKTYFETFSGPSFLTAVEARQTTANVMNFKISVLLCFKMCCLKMPMFWNGCQDIFNLCYISVNNVLWKLSLELSGSLRTSSNSRKCYKCQSVGVALF